MGQIRADIKQACAECGHSMADLSRATDISYPRMSGWVNGYWSITPQEERKIKDTLAEWGKK
jgi:lambda repressor-like predicted transcriptional regulator